jgi:two-component system NtrC family sensor kinase
LENRIVFPSVGSFHARAFIDALLPLSLFVSDNGVVISFSTSMVKSAPSLADNQCFDDVFEVLRPSGFNGLKALVDTSFFVIIKDRKTGNLFKCTKLNGESNMFCLACNPVLTEQNSPADYGLSVSDFAPHDIIAEYLFVMKANRMGMREANELIEAVTLKNRQLEQARRDLVRLNQMLEDKADRTEADLRKAESELKEGEKLALIGRLAAGVAHEMNTPLGAIASSAENLSSTLQLLFKEGLRDVDHTAVRTACQFAEDLSAIITLSSREERAEKKRLAQHLREKYAQEDADSQSRTLVHCGITADNDKVLEHIFTSSNVNLTLDITTTIMKVRRSIRTMELATQRAANVIRALKSYVRSDASDAAVIFDARRSIHDVLLLFNSQMKRGIQLHMDMQDELPIRGNETEVSKIWANLISNAIYAMNYQGNLWIEGHADHMHTTLRFTNDGPPIPEMVKARLFEPFYTTKPIGEGSGMGMSIVAGIVNSLQGRITVDTGKVTTFAIIIPHPAN